MDMPLNELKEMVFRPVDRGVMHQFSGDFKTFNILMSLDGQRSVGMIASEDAYDLDGLAQKIRELYRKGVIERVHPHNRSVGRCKLLLDAIIKKRSKGIGFIAKSLKIKLALKGINPDAFTPHTPDNPVVLKKLEKLATSYGIRMEAQPQADQSIGRTKMLLDTIIIQRSGGNPVVAKAIKTKFMLRGINTDAYSFDTPDDPMILKQLESLAKRLGVNTALAVSSGGKADLVF